MNFLDVMNLWPSPDDLAADLKVKASRVYKWRSRRKIPSSVWPAMLVAAKQRGFNVDANTLVSGLSTRLHDSSRAA